MLKPNIKSFLAILLLTAVLPLLPQAATPTTIQAQEPSRLFPETGKTVRGIFLQYWNEHGGLAQQGYPITDEMTLKSTDGKEYRTQFFQRAVFEHHPEYAGTPNEVLLKLVGQTFHERRFKSSPPPGQAANPNNTYPFNETGHAIGGTFRAYWEKHGGLAQQGFPITDEFKMASTDGKEYTTQVFQRAVFELHPEYVGTENEVLLRLLGVEELEELSKPAATATPNPISVPPTIVPPTETVNEAEDFTLAYTNSRGEYATAKLDNSTDPSMPRLVQNQNPSFIEDNKELLKRVGNPDVLKFTQKFVGFASDKEGEDWVKYSNSVKNSDGTRDGGIAGIFKLNYKAISGKPGKYDLEFQMKYKDAENYRRIQTDEGLKAAYSIFIYEVGMSALASPINSTDIISYNDFRTKVGADQTGLRLFHRLGINVQGYPTNIRQNPWETFANWESK